MAERRWMVDAARKRSSTARGQTHWHMGDQSKPATELHSHGELHNHWMWQCMRPPMAAHHRMENLLYCKFQCKIISIDRLLFRGKRRVVGAGAGDASGRPLTALDSIQSFVETYSTCLCKFYSLGLAGLAGLRFLSQIMLFLGPRDTPIGGIYNLDS